MLRCASRIAATAFERGGSIFKYGGRYTCHRRRGFLVHDPPWGTGTRCCISTRAHMCTRQRCYSTTTGGNNGAGDGSDSRILEKALTRGYSPFLTKFFQLLPARDQEVLRLFSDSLGNTHTTSKHVVVQYRAMKRNNLHRYLTIHAMQRLIKRVSSQVQCGGLHMDDQPSSVIVQLISDYSQLGFTPGISEYASLVRALAHESGREAEALQLLDEIVDSSDIAPFLASLKRKRDRQLPMEAMIPSDAEIARIEGSLIHEERQQSAGLQQTLLDGESLERSEGGIERDIAAVGLPDVNAAKQASDLDRVQMLVVRERQRRKMQLEAEDARPASVSRTLYHMAMRGFAQVYHVRGVMSVLGRMLETATQVPFRIARHLMPNKETWDILGEVLVRQRDRPTFVKMWIDFLSRGARPPVFLTRSLIKMLVRQSCVEQAVWVMRISRCLPDVGERLPRSPHATDHVPWDLKVQTMYVASALESATSLDAIIMTRSDAIRQGRAAAQLPLLDKPDPEIYAQLIGGAVRLHNEKLASHLFQELVDAGVAPDSATYGHLASLYAGKGQIKRVFLIARDSLVRRHQLLAQQKIQRGLLDSPTARTKYKEKVRRQVSSLKADVECITPLLQFYLRENRAQEALALLRSWDHVYGERVPADKFARALLEVYSRPGDTASAERLVESVVSQLVVDKPDITDGDSSRARVAPDDADTDANSTLQTFGQAIKVHARARNLPGVVQVLKEMTKCNIQPPYHIWDLVMRCFLREQAIDLFDTVHAYLRDTLKLPLTLPLYSLWMRSLRNHGDVVGVQAAFDELLELGQIPTQQHYLLLVQAYAYNGWVERAVSIVENLRKPYSVLRPGLSLDIAVIESYVASGNMERAEAELHYLLENTRLARDRIPARPFNYLIIGHLHYGNGARAMQTYEDMGRLGIKPDVYTFSILMHSYALARDLDNCMRVFNEMIRVGVAPDLVIYTILIWAFGVANKLSSAELVFGQVAREQQWAQELVQKQGHTQPLAEPHASAPESLDIYTEDPNRPDWPEVLDTFEIGDSNAMEQMRTSSFLNLDPVVYIAMLKVYSIARRPMRALATWERLIKNFPVVQWNPRKGGVLSKSLHYTGSFHMPALTLLLRTVRRSIGVSNVLRRKSSILKYVFTPLYLSSFTSAMASRLRQKQLLLKCLGDLRSPPSTVAQRALSRMKSRSLIVKCVEKEINARLAFDHRFCAEYRHQAPKVAASDIAWFVGFEYWMPQGAEDLLVPNDGDDNGFVPSADDASRSTHASDIQLIGPDGKFTQQSAQDMASIVARQWQELEVAGFKLNNIHVSEYIPCMLVGRQYSHLVRFLSLVQPLTPASSSFNSDEISSHTQFRYRNISIPRRSSDLLVLQIEAVQQLLLGDRDKRIILEALIGPDSHLRREYTCHSIYGDVDTPRDEDELQVMRERRVIHAERELSWAAELAYLVQIARLWRQHIGDNVAVQSRVDEVVACAEQHLE
ncbi:hypothetical protein GGH93_002580 [Coemansia aciculifera]|nr:hypothetical protein GGH93_002580 [Coemansia aciculifera]